MATCLSRSRGRGGRLSCHQLRHEQHLCQPCGMRALPGIGPTRRPALSVHVHVGHPKCFGSAAVNPSRSGMGVHGPPTRAALLRPPYADRARSGGSYGYREVAVRFPRVAAPGTAIDDYVERTFGRFVADRSLGDAPLSPWTPMPESGLERLCQHLSGHYGVEVRSVTPLDCGVVRVDRRDKVRWIARVFPPARSISAAEEDVAVLRWLEARSMPAERLAHEDPLTTVEGHAVLVTEFAPGKPISATRATGEWTGDALGRLHALSLEDAPSRKGGGWHHLSMNGGGRVFDVALLHELLADAAASSEASAASIAELRAALDALDLGDGLPEAMVHVDFGGPNVLRDKERYTVIDWTGSGRASRVASLASVVFPQGDTGIDVIAGAYGSHITPTAEELDRVEAMMLTHQLVLAAWGVLFDVTRVGPLVAQLPAAQASAAKKAARLRKAFIA